MRWLAVCVCLLWPEALSAWDKLNAVEGGAIWRSAGLGILARQSIGSAAEIELPRLSGAVTRFRIKHSNFLLGTGSGVAAYEGEALGEAGVRLNLVADEGKFFAQILTPHGIEYIDPFPGAGSEKRVKVYAGDAGLPPDFKCLVEPSEPLAERETMTRQSNGQVIRTFRLAGAATAEFTEFHGSKEAAYLSVVAALNRAHGIFERELGVRFQLVAATEDMIFTEKATDPYSTNEAGYELLRDAQRAFDARVGNANYDLGIVLTRGLYGLAYIRSVCDPERKGASCIGLPEPTGDAFHVNLVTHELGHQFGANHTFNSPTGFCAERRSEWTAFEPGAGSTIMSYASLPCEGDSFASGNDAYFHFESLKEISAFLNGAAAQCAMIEPIDNRPPVVHGGADRHIPILTPFALTAAGSDPDGDAITYCWEERDLGPPQVLGAPDNGLSPLFRSYPPTSNPTRIFPALPYILANEHPAFEQLPSTQRTLRFRVTARDSKNLGAHSWADLQVGVIDTGVPFQVTSHAQAEALTNSTTEVRWDVAGTTNGWIATSQVRITLSTDGGQTFGHVLAEATANDGAEVVSLPTVDSSAVRIKVEAVGNIFFSINRGTLTLGEPGTALSKIEWERTDHGLQITWESQPGRTYRVEQTSSIEGADWDEIYRGEAQFTETSITVDPGNGSALFFRVARE